MDLRWDHVANSSYTQFDDSKISLWFDVVTGNWTLAISKDASFGPARYHIVFNARYAATRCDALKVAEQILQMELQ